MVSVFATSVLPVKIFQHGFNKAFNVANPRKTWINHFRMGKIFASLFSFISQIEPLIRVNAGFAALSVTIVLPVETIVKIVVSNGTFCAKHENSRPPPSRRERLCFAMPTGSDLEKT